MKWIKERNTNVSASVQDILKNRQKLYNGLEAKKKNLIDMRADDEINALEFKTRREELEVEMKALEKDLDKAKTDSADWMNLAENMFLFVERAVTKFKNGSIEDKRAITMALGSNFTLRDKKLFIDLHPCLKHVQKLSELVNVENKAFEPLECVDTQGQNGADYVNSPSVLADRESNPDFLDQNQASYR